MMNRLTRFLPVWSPLMRRRQSLPVFNMIVAITVSSSCLTARTLASKVEPTTAAAARATVSKSPSEWRAQLTATEYRVTREKGTEAPWSSPFNHMAPGTSGHFSCVCCGAPLFRTAAKFDSGSGWPSFFEPVVPEAVSVHIDRSHGMTREEVTCATCNAHLGHVFPDGPKPSGLRYCINGVSLKFKEDNERKEL